MQALLQAAQEMLQSIQSLLETSQEMVQSSRSVRRDRKRRTRRDGARKTRKSVPGSTNDGGGERDVSVNARSKVGVAIFPLVLPQADTRNKVRQRTSKNILY